MLHSFDLGGDDWKIRYSDGERGRREHAEKAVVDPAKAIDGHVPGEVHLDLMRAGLLQDPYVGTNVLAARWVEEFDWTYRRNFVAPSVAVGARAWLIFEGLDYTADILLNGEKIGQHHNAFRPCRLEITGKLREGDNLLVVHLSAGMNETADKPMEGYLQKHHRQGPKRHWLRKPQCSFGWDWAPQLVNVGIFKPCRLEWTDSPARLDRLVPLVEMDADLRRATVRSRLWIEGLSSEPTAATLAVAIAGTPAEAKIDVQIKPGLHRYEILLEVDSPRLWWPVGHGPQELYELSARVEIAGTCAGESSARIGFRHVRVNQEPHPQAGRYFLIEVNGHPIFCKGGNLVPADMIFTRLDRARYKALVELALEANFNFLRVWGGGIYESDDFYELCDQRGILVWQEFIFACNRYPAHDAEFSAEVRLEAIHNIRRLASHPSLVAWCGNNEMEQGNWDWGWDREGQILPDHGLFHHLLPRLMAQEDPTRYYQPSSPFSPDGQHPQRDDVGDQHPWSIGFFDTDFRKYRKMICRFPNEGGILGPTALPTMLACLPQGKQRAIGSFAWQVHDNSVDAWGEPSFVDAMFHQWIGRDIRSMSIEDFTYFGGIIQAEGLREYIDNFRRRMFSSAAAIFWMFNDTWPATRSWTIVDYYLRRTPSFWAVRRAMAPISVVVVNENDRVEVFGINDTPQAVTATLRFGLFSLAGEYTVDESAQVTLRANASTPIGSFPADRWTDPQSSAAFAMLHDANGQLLARNRLLLPLFRDIEWPTSQPTVRVENGRAIFQSENFAWNVCLDLDGETPLADNLFDLYPGVPYAIAWPHSSPPRILRVGNLPRLESVPEFPVPRR